MLDKLVPAIPESIVCFANLSGVGNAFFANLFKIGFYKQVKKGDIVNLPQYGGRYEIGAVWSREEHIARYFDER